MQAERGLGYGCPSPTAKAAGYASTAPTGLTPSGIADFVSQIEF